MAERPQEPASGYTCREVVELVTEYLDGAMTPDERAALEVHLNYCDGCATFLEQIRTSASLAGGVAPEQIPEDVTEALRAAFRARREP